MSTREYDDFTEFSRLAEGRLSAEEFEQIQERLMTDAEFRRRYVRFMDMDFELAQRLGEEVPVPESAPAPAQTVPLPAPSLTPVTESAPTSRVPSAPSRKPAPSAPSRNGFGRALLKLAAILVLGVGAWWVATTYNFEFGDLKFTSAPPEENADPPIEDPIVEPSPDPETKEPEIAHAVAPDPPVPGPKPDPAVTETGAPPVKPAAPMVADTTPDDTGAKPVSEEDAFTVLGWVRSVDDRSGTWEPGMELTAGEYDLARGTMEIRLDAGHEEELIFESASGFEEAFPGDVRLLVEGPTRFALRSADHIQLLAGKLSAEVFPIAKGFTVTANSVEVVDLGTRFAVSANTEGDVAVHVYDGTVTGKVADAAVEPATIRSGETVRLDLETDRLKPIAFQASRFAARPAWMGGIEEHSPTVRVLDRPPRAVNGQALFPGNEAVIFREQSGVVLRDDLHVHLAEPGEVITRKVNAPRGKIPGGAKVTSYLIHFDSDDPKVVARAQATIRFDSPILGVIFGDEELLETDRSLGALGTDYPGSGSSAERGLEFDDKLRLHDDRRTLSIQFNAKLVIDQARILVAKDS